MTKTGADARSPIATSKRPSVPSSTGSRADDAYRQLKVSIQSGQFAPGQPMREAALATWLGISRTPVRDALKQLESEGLVVAAPRRGLIVAELDQQQVSEIYALRAVLEGLAARMASSHASPAEISALRDIIARQEAMEASPGVLADLNRLFHQLIYRAARNRYLLDVLESLESTLALLPGTTYSSPGRPWEACVEHRAIVDAMETRDAALAESAAQEHIRSAERIRLLMLNSAS